MSRPDDIGQVALPMTYWDAVVDVKLRADAYPYGAGVPGVGVQLTLQQLPDGPPVALRLPGPSAHLLGLAILTAVGDTGTEPREERA